MSKLGKLSVVAIPMIVAASLGAQADAPFSTPPDFVSPLSGGEEVPIRDTDANGIAHFKIVEGGLGLAYRLIVQDIDNVTASHIHLAPAGTNGSVVAFLYPDAAPGGGPISGNIAEGVIHASDLRGPLLGQSLSVLIEAIQTGGVYTNVHTNDGIAPTNTGPGDFPGGEIRGQLRKARANNPNLSTVQLRD